MEKERIKDRTTQGLNQVLLTTKIFVKLILEFLKKGNKHHDELHSSQMS